MSSDSQVGTPADSSTTQRVTSVTGEVTETRHRTSVTDMIGIVCLTAFAIVALVRNHEAAAMAAIMVIPGIVGVRSALNTASRAANGQSGMSGIVLIVGASIVGVARLLGRG